MESVILDPLGLEHFFTQGRDWALFVNASAATAEEAAAPADAVAFAPRLQFSAALAAAMFASAVLVGLVFRLCDLRDVHVGRISFTIASAPPGGWRQAFIDTFFSWGKPVSQRELRWRESVRAAFGGVEPPFAQRNARMSRLRARIDALGVSAETAKHHSRQGRAEKRSAQRAGPDDSGALGVSLAELLHKNLRRLEPKPASPAPASAPFPASQTEQKAPTPPEPRPTLAEPHTALAEPRPTKAEISDAAIRLDQLLEDEAASIDPAMTDEDIVEELEADENEREAAIELAMQRVSILARRAQDRRRAREG